MNVGVITDCIFKVRGTISSLMDELTDKYIADVFEMVRAKLEESPIYSVYSMFAVGIKNGDLTAGELNLLSEVRFEKATKDITASGLEEVKYPMSYHDEMTRTYDLRNPVFKLFVTTLSEKGFDIYIDPDNMVLYPFIRIRDYEC